MLVEEYRKYRKKSEINTIYFFLILHDFCLFGDEVDIKNDPTEIMSDTFVPDEEQHDMAIYHEFLAPDESGYRIQFSKILKIH